jgi:ketopantoate reductase
MYLDLQNKTPTEIDYLNGKIVELGRQFDDLDTSINRIFCALVVSAEIKNNTRTVETIPEYIMSHRSDCGKYLV